MVQIVFRNPWVRALGLVLVLSLVSLLAYLLSAVLIPLFLAFLVAYSLDPIVDKFEARRLPRMAGIVFLLFLIFAVTLAVPLVGIPAFIQETKDFMHAASTGPQDPWFDKLTEVLRVRTLLESLNWVAPGEADVDIRQVIASRIGEYLSHLTVDQLKGVGPGILTVGNTAQSTVRGILSSLGGSLVNLILVVGNFALFAFVAVYLLNDYDKIIASGNALIPPRFRPTVGRIMKRIDLQLRAFLRGQVIVCASLGTMYAIGLSLSGTKFAIALGCFGALASFVPYLGLVLTIGPAVLLTVLDYGFDWHLVGVLTTFVVAQAIEGNFLTPKIVGSQVGLSPVWVILAIMVFSSALGFLGLLLAVPMAACLKVLVEEGLTLYRNSKFFDGSAMPGAPAFTLTVPDSSALSPAADDDPAEPAAATKPAAKSKAKPKAKRAPRKKKSS